MEKMRPTGWSRQKAEDANQSEGPPVQIDRDAKQEQAKAAGDKMGMPQKKIKQKESGIGYRIIERGHPCILRR